MIGCHHWSIYDNVCNKKKNPSLNTLIRTPVYLVHLIKITIWFLCSAKQSCTPTMVGTLVRSLHSHQAMILNDKKTQAFYQVKHIHLIYIIIKAHICWIKSFFTVKNIISGTVIFYHLLIFNLNFISFSWHYLQFQVGIPILLIRITRNIKKNVSILLSPRFLAEENKIDKQ